MKQIILNIIFTTFCCSITYSQKLSLTDLTNLCNKKNWEDVNQTLLAKNWTYYDSEKGSTHKYSTITWSFNKENYSDKAQGWFYLYTYEGYPNKISYSVFNKESYSLIQNSISSADFKLVNSEIKDNAIISTYSNANYTLEISTEKREKSDYHLENKSFTAYTIIIIKKAGIYDTDNGKKTDYYYGDVVKAEYSLLNGKINGKVKTYHNNGKLKLIGFYTNGIKNGLFKEYDVNGILETEYSMSNGEFNGALKAYYSNGRLKKASNFLKGKEDGNFVEYDEYGNIESEYVMANGMKNGVMKIYKDGKIDVSTTFKDDIRNGQRVEFYYNEETGKLKLKYTGEYIDNEKNGVWKLFFVGEDNTERLLTYENFTKGLKNGLFQDTKGDSLIVGSYKNDELHGEYKIYRDFVRSLFGGVINTDISKLTLTSEGSYFEGLQSGYWKYYDFTGALRREGRFSIGEETGEWKYYYSNWGDGKGGNMVYANQLYLVENYSNGKLDGKSIRYSNLKEEEYSCYEIDENKSPLDTCKRFVFQKILETAFYKKGKLNGPFEVRDSINEIIVKGNFKDDLKDGEWLQRYSDKDFNDENYFIYQKGNYVEGKRDGKWIQYYTEGKTAATFNYKLGELHGEYILWNHFNKPSKKKQFNNGKLTALTTYDSLGGNLINKYEIYDENYNSYKCRKTEFYSDNTSSSQEYWVKKEKDIDHNWFELNFLIAIEKTFSDETKGHKEGEFRLFNSNNQPIVTGKFYKEDRIGLWTFYYYDQNVKIESNFTADKRVDEKYLNLNGGLFSGEFGYFDNDNGIKEERKIKDGLRNGKTVYSYTKTKRTIKKEIYKNGVLK